MFGAVFDPVMVLAAVAVITVTYYVVRFAVRQRQFSTVLNRIPGPPTVLFFGNILQELVPRNRHMEFINHRAEQYGPIHRTWAGPFGEVHLTSPEHIEVILNSSKHISKSPAYLLLKPWLGTGLLTSDGAKWHTRRKILTPAFHFSILEQFFEIFVDKSEILVDKLDQEMSLNGDNGFDVYPLVTRCALDIICQTAMGTDIHAQDDASSKYVEAVGKISTLIIQRAIRPWLFVDFIFNLTKMGRSYNHCLQVLHGFTNKVIIERRAEHQKSGTSVDATNNEENAVGRKKRLALLDLLLQDVTEGNVLTDQDIREEVDTFMFEGHDTTTAAIAWTLFLIGSHPDVQDKLIDELDAIFQISDHAMTIRDINQMKYLERVVKESLRLYPSVPFIGRLLNESVLCGDYEIPAGTLINIHIYHVHRNQEHFPNPEQFDPDNFLPERLQGRHPYAYIPFSAGPRNCIGQKFALLEEKTILATLLRRFTVRSLEERENLTLMSELILRPESGIKMVLKHRHRRAACAQ